MNLLAINTAFKKANIALLKGEEVYASELTEKHSETTLPEIQKLLHKANLNPQDLNFIAVCVGPGSFTGIRVGIALVKGFSVSNKKLKFIKFNSFELMYEENSKQDGNYLIDALGGKFFIATANNGKLTEPKLDSVILDKKCFGLLEENLSFIKKGLDISSKSMLNVCKNKINNNEFVKSSDLIPIYLRRSQAEENLDNLKLEPLTQKHLESVFNLSKEAFGTSSWSFKMFEDELIEQNRFSYVISSGGEVHSFINVLECEGENGAEYNILNIATKNEYKNKGFASQLLDFVFEKARKNKINNVWLEVDAKNENAITLYKNNGFNQIAVRKKYYKNGNDALILRKDI